MCQNIFNQAVRKPRTTRVEVARYVEKESKVADAYSICNMHYFFSKRDLAKHDNCLYRRGIKKNQVRQNIINTDVSPRVKVARSGEKEKESKDVTSSIQVSQTDNCCIDEYIHVNLFFSLDSLS